MQSYSGKESVKEGHGRRRVVLVVLVVICVAALLAAILASVFSGSMQVSSVVEVRTPSAGMLNLANELVPQHTLGTSPFVCGWSGDGRVITMEGDRTVQSWDAESGDLISTSAPLSSTGGFNCSPDGRRAAVGVFSNTIELVDLSTGQVGRMISPLLAAARDGVTRPDLYIGLSSQPLGWSDDGRELLTVTTVFAQNGSPEPGLPPVREPPYTSVQCWEVATGRMLAHISIENDIYLEQYALSPNGSVVAAAYFMPGPDGAAMSIKVWETQTGRQLGDVILEDYAPQPLRWSPDGRTLAVMLDRQVRLINVATMKVSMSLPEALPPPSRPNSQPNPVSTRLSSVVPAPAGTAGAMQINPVRTAPPPAYTPPVTPVSLLGVADPSDYGSVTRIAWSPDGATIATYDSKQIRFWDAASGKLNYISRHPETFYAGASVGWSADGRLFATVDRESAAYVLRLWDGATAAPLRELAVDLDRLGFQWSPKGLELGVVRGSEYKMELWGTKQP